MSKRFLSDQAKRALTEAVQRIESHSSAEVVISVRARSSRYLHVPVLFGVIAAFAAQAFMLYSPYEFSLLAILIDPFVTGGLVGLLVAQIPAMARWFTPRSVRRARVRRAAEATFFTGGVRLTSERTGILVYLSLTERIACLLGDRAVVEAVPPERWQAVTDQISAVLALGGDGDAVARQLDALIPLLSPVLIRADDDVNELPDEVDAP
ncbi:MAG: hypothetical protein AAGC55_13705 [Myxococcota bacterium]